MNWEVTVISLERTPKRLELFKKRNIKALKNFDVIYGFDGNNDWEIIKKSKLISENSTNTWSKGAIGSGLSHVMAWRRCIEKNIPMIVIEDDTIISHKWKEELSTLIKSQLKYDFILLGWNFDSALKVEFLNNIDQTSLFNPAYPNETEINLLLEENSRRNLYRLKNAFGLPGYLITPRCAEIFIKKMLPLRQENISIGRGMPEIKSCTLDAQLNKIYKSINAYITISPITVALNNPEDSLTNKRKNPRDFSTS